TLTVYGKGEPTATGAEPTATGAEPTATGAEPTEPVTLVETVLVENNVGGAKVLKPEKTDAWFLQVDEIKADIAANGPIDPSKGEYYKIEVTGYVDIGEADFHLGEGLNWEEYWGKSGVVGTEETTAVAYIVFPIPAEGIGAVYLADSGEAGHTLTWTYAKVSVFRVGEPTEPIVTESEPQSTETEPAATETTSDVAIYGDANGDGVVNLKDVLVARKYVAGIETEIDLVTSDVNQDGAVNMKDILLIRKFIAGLITSFDA
ncbi:MAG: dockerin type I repeat-containing protein, partial [Clostridia bacterium]|nr:dockerin type I repeat-containing protein [Clostridia bacterium]